MTTMITSPTAMVIDGVPVPLDVFARSSMLAAFHEAGHAVAALAWGLTVTVCEIHRARGRVIGGGYTGMTGRILAFEAVCADAEIGMAGPVAEAVASWRLAHGSGDWSNDEVGLCWADHLMGITAWGGGCQDAAELAASGYDELTAITAAAAITTQEWVAVDAIARAILLKPNWSLDAGDIARLWTAHRNSTWIPALPSLADDEPW
jgi:hypothetical protein